MKTTSRRLRAVAAFAVLLTGATACSTLSAGTQSSGSATPKNVSIVVDTGPGGGSDLFAREVVKLAQQTKGISSNWPVVSQTAGGGLGAMAFMKGKANQTNFVAAFTSKWVISALSTNNPPASLKDLTPIAELANETQLIAVPAGSPYHNFNDFVRAAKQHPGQLVQTGGAPSSVDNLVALKVEKDTGTKWKYLSFADGGPRITALLRGDAQMMIGSQSDFQEQVDAGKLRIIAVFSDKRMAAYPNVPTMTEQGFDLSRLPAQLQFRGIAGPPGMSQQAVAYYVGVLGKMVKSPGWQQYMTSEGDTTEFVTGPALKTLINKFTTSMQPLVTSLSGAGQ
ncbi:MAG TPA: tripartite tricarboxylate transporter substrate binding protein [Pseudonocardiaceae bacterium]|jgi:putative tricarboxylic transport membrane protein|nr:tripartite tricarboxylate transporter substrate binding protein [Pseudonocardiaceae bacterium]